MKLRMVLMLVSVSLISFSCVLMGGVRGNGNLETRFLDLKDFSKVEFDGSMNATITEGDEFVVKVTTDSNLFEKLEAKVDREKLSVGFKSGINSYTEYKVDITMPTIESLEIDGSADTRLLGFDNLENLRIEINGSGDVEADLKVNEKLECDISGSGSISLKGEAEKLVYSGNGSGDLRALDLRAKFGKIDCSGSGDAKVNVSKELKASLSGSGSIRYQGEPKNLSISSSGSGSIKKLD